MRSLNVDMFIQIQSQHVMISYSDHFINCVLGKVRGLPYYMTSDVKEVAGKSFDYIVVGGGTTACPLAATLSENFSVLLVERGGSPFGNPLVTDKSYYGLSLVQTDEYTSLAQSFVSKDGVQNYRRTRAWWIISHKWRVLQ